MSKKLIQTTTSLVCFCMLSNMYNINTANAMMKNEEQVESKKSINRKLNFSELTQKWKEAESNRRMIEANKMIEDGWGSVQIGVGVIASSQTIKTGVNAVCDQDDPTDQGMRKSADLIARTMTIPGILITAYGVGKVGMGLYAKHFGEK